MDSNYHGSLILFEFLKQMYLLLNAFSGHLCPVDIRKSIYLLFQVIREGYGILFIISSAA
ncbi:hypothetical protein Mpsy_0613 [Methanolobus psychrophilus R15]|nr:hypothetical protein Mpsy_0613 [Methanolobus psychrophilus R15]